MDEHAWQTRSTHPTSDGLVRYQSCSTCGRWRVIVVTAGEPVSRPAAG
ncbi:hypothetical protein BJY16_006184 [Actinoplanes octamycinicus]|uniref:Uncharacterized protein n=1 Tax=Actinoplanes octamycinicus TaxID=135948 RepID=A0A7W7MAD4_9ACTN|nr:hypothetical protein [Actinoplanes octamycinicus]MBB4742725.1 hypothetical protein [Actinoplanes octamycinicus]